MDPLTVEDRLLIKALRIETGWNVDRMTAEFPVRQWKRRTFTVKRSMTLITRNRSWSAAGTQLAGNWLMRLLTSGCNDCC